MHIIVYSQSGGNACEQEKAWLSQQGWAFEDRNIRERNEWVHELIALGSQSTPTTIVERDGQQQVIIGFRQRSLSNAIQKLST